MPYFWSRCEGAQYLEMHGWRFGVTERAWRVEMVLTGVVLWVYRLHGRCRVSAEVPHRVHVSICFCATGGTNQHSCGKHEPNRNIHGSKKCI